MCACKFVVQSCHLKASAEMIYLVITWCDLSKGIGALSKRPVRGQWRDSSALESPDFLSLHVAATDQLVASRYELAARFFGGLL